MFKRPSPAVTAMAVFVLGVMVGCARGAGSSTSPTSPSQGATTGSLPAIFWAAQSAAPMATFPPRNEPFQFRQALETYYRDTLRRATTQTAVDLEGGIVWTQEYLRFRLSACDHLASVSKVLQQIDTGANPTECGGSAGIPPRNEPFDFRFNHLEAKYRDGLRRAPTTTFVDIEGDIVWTTEYFRYRLSGCDHADATQKTLTQVAGGTAPPTCAVESAPTSDSVTILSLSPPSGSTVPAGNANGVTATVRYSLASRDEAYVCVLARLSLTEPGPSDSSCFPQRVTRGTGTAAVRFVVGSGRPNPLETRALWILLGTSPQFPRPWLVDRFEDGRFVWTNP